MKENYSVNWSVFDNKELTSILTKVNPDLLCDIENILNGKIVIGQLK